MLICNLLKKIYIIKRLKKKSLLLSNISYASKKIKVKKIYQYKRPRSKNSLKIENQKTKIGKLKPK